MGKKKDKLAKKAAAEEPKAAAEEPPAEAEAAATKKKLAAKADAVEERPAKRKKKSASEAPAPAAAVSEEAPAPVAAAANEGGEAHAEGVFSAACVIFFTRDAAGRVAEVLTGVEERKVSAGQLGLDAKGKVSRRMLVFPMGRREKKDKQDCVETAKREYVEETGDYGALTEFLDVADFSGEGQPVAEGLWTGKHNMAVFYKPASMICLFCEVPADAAKRTHRAAERGVQLGPDGEPLDKRLKKGDAMPKPSPSYHVGKTDHLECSWIKAAGLREALASGERCPEVDFGEERCRLFPLTSGVLRMNEARSWLGMPATSAKAA